MNPSTRRALAGEQGARPQGAPEDQSVAAPVWAMWVHCLMDDRLHLLDRRCVLDLAAMGCTVACCGALLLTPQLVLRGWGTPCGQCLAARNAS